MVCAETIAKGLGGRKVARGWMVRCPAHDDRKPSLSIRDADDGKVLVFCHAGCDQEQVIANLRSLGLWQRAIGAGSGTPNLAALAKGRSNPLHPYRRDAAASYFLRCLMK